MDSRNEHDKRAKALIQKIMKQEKTSFEKGETPAETLVNLHNSEVIQDHESRIGTIEEANMQMQLNALAAQIHAAQRTVQELNKKLAKQSTKADQSTQENVQTVAKASTPRLASAVNTTSVWIRNAKGDVVRNPNFGQKANYDKYFYLHHYGVSYNPSGYSGLVY